jgi:hypothetical protein
MQKVAGEFNPSTRSGTRSGLASPNCPSSSGARMRTSRFGSFSNLVTAGLAELASAFKDISAHNAVTRTSACRSLRPATRPGTTDGPSKPIPETIWGIQQSAPGVGEGSRCRPHSGPRQTNPDLQAALHLLLRTPGFINCRCSERFGGRSPWTTARTPLLVSGLLGNAERAVLMAKVEEIKRLLDPVLNPQKRQA